MFFHSCLIFKRKRLVYRYTYVGPEVQNKLNMTTIIFTKHIVKKQHYIFGNQSQIPKKQNAMEKKK